VATPLVNQTRKPEHGISIDHPHSLARGITKVKLRTKLLINICLVMCSAYSPTAQYLPGFLQNREAETLFEKSLANYIRGEYDGAKQGFQTLVESFPTNQRTSAARLMLAKSYLKLKDYNLAFAAALELYDHFPYSRYLPEANLVIGDCKFKQGQIFASATDFAHVLTGRGDLRLKTRAADRLGQMAGAGHLFDRDLARLRSDFGRSIIDEAVAFGKARWALKLGHAQDYKSKLSLFLEQYPNGAFGTVAQQTLRPKRRPPKAPVLAKPEKPVEGPIDEPVNARYKVGIIAPMETAAGKDLRDGILLAREQVRLLSGENVGLIFKDSEGDPIRAVLAAKSLIEDHQVIAIIGALTSSETIPIASLAGALEVPLVAPTASEDGIASLSSFVFQMNATPGAQGRRLADYAVKELGLRALATLTSRDNYGKRIAGEYTARAEELGAEVIVQAWYESGTTDYRGQFKRIRDAGLALRPPEILAEELDSILLGGIHVQPPPPIPVDPDTVDPEPVEALDGLLVAGGRDDVLLIVPQIAFHQIHAQLIGSDGWNHPEVARNSYAKDAIFVAKYYDQSDIQSVRQFVDTFRTRFRRDQSIAAALGYDGMLAVLTALNAGGTSRSLLQQQLEELGSIPGATGRISFNKGNRENAWMYLLNIRGGKIMPLTDGLDIETAPEIDR
jgi:branched-chain amino acid transport system substrate-binding protein